MGKQLFFVLFLSLSIYSYSQTRVEAESYTSMSGVTVENGWGDGGGTNIYPIDNGDWMEYVINPSTAGVHTFLFRVGAVASGAQFKVKKQDGTVLATLSVPNTSDYQMFQTIAATFQLSAGTQTIRIESIATERWTFNWFEYSIGYKLEAEINSGTNGVSLETAQDAGGGLDVNYIDAGDWMDYPVNILSAGDYTLKFRIASTVINGQLQVKNSAGSVLATVSLPNTNGWQTWTTQTFNTNITLSAGQQTLRIYVINGGWNFNWWLLLPVPNTPPVVNAGSDQTVTSSNTTLNGSASDANGTISSYLWTIISGPAGSNFESSSAATTNVTGLVPGTYIFRLTATDNEGTSSMDEVMVTVSAASTGGQWLTSGNSNTDPATQFIGTTDNQPLIFKVNSQQQAKLTTDGVFTARKIKVTQIGWADYVFDSSYTLIPISEVEKFINEHRHLPGLPSQKEVIISGVDIGTNQTILLQKIEELTLYIIELNKQIEVLKQATKKNKRRSKI